MEMGTEQFIWYVGELERTVIIPGMRTGLYGKPAIITTRRGKLADTQFASLLGPSFIHTEPAVIDYYGYLKKSESFYFACMQNPKHKVLQCKLLHFASIKIEHINDLNQLLVAEFPIFKRDVIELRGF